MVAVVAVAVEMAIEVAVELVVEVHVWQLCPPSPSSQKFERLGISAAL